MKLILFATIAILVSSCKKQSIESSQTNNSEISVELLFEKDGVKVYRFQDGGRFIYYTDARGKTEWYSGGKNKTLHEVETTE